MRTQFARVRRIFVTLIVAAWLSIAFGPRISRSHPVLAQHERSRQPNADVRVGVLGLFHPKAFRISTVIGQALVLRAGSQTVTLEQSSGVDCAEFHISDHDVVGLVNGRVFRAYSWTATGRNGEPADFLLTIPGKIVRHYRGELEIKMDGDHLLAIVSMDPETAVASVVAAESTADTAMEALKAQAIATRSYFVAGRGRHRDFDFCDTTHCQFLREPPAWDSAAARAVAATHSLVLAHDSRPFAAMYTRSCSGQTRTPSQLGLPSSDYSYYSVECAYCRSHPARWSAPLSANDAASLRSSNELSRLRLARRLGWDVVPSNDFIIATRRGQTLVAGTGYGHGIGLCQSGAAAMAREGADFREILGHYYPNTTIITSPESNRVAAHSPQLASPPD